MPFGMFLDLLKIFSNQRNLNKVDFQSLVYINEQCNAYEHGHNLDLLFWKMLKRLMCVTKYSQTKCTKYVGLFTKIIWVACFFFVISYIYFFLFSGLEIEYPGGKIQLFRHQLSMLHWGMLHRHAAAYKKLYIAQLRRANETMPLKICTWSISPS